MPGIAITNVHMTPLLGLADLERLEGPWFGGWPPLSLKWNSKQLLGAMVLDLLDLQLSITRLDVDVCHAVVDDNSFSQPGCQHGNDSTSATA